MQQIPQCPTVVTERIMDVFRQHLPIIFHLEAVQFLTKILDVLFEPFQL